MLRSSFVRKPRLQPCSKTTLQPRAILVRCDEGVRLSHNVTVGRQHKLDLGDQLGQRLRSAKADVHRLALFGGLLRLWPSMRHGVRYRVTQQWCNKSIVTHDNTRKGSKSKWGVRLLPAWRLHCLPSRILQRNASGNPRPCKIQRASFS